MSPVDLSNCECEVTGDFVHFISLQVYGCGLLYPGLFCHIEGFKIGIESGFKRLINVLNGSTLVKIFLIFRDLTKMQAIMPSLTFDKEDEEGCYEQQK